MPRPVYPMRLLAEWDLAHHLSVPVENRNHRCLWREARLHTLLPRVTQKRLTVDHIHGQSDLAGLGPRGEPKQPVASSSEQAVPLPPVETFDVCISRTIRATCDVGLRVLDAELTVEDFHSDSRIGSSGVIPEHWPN